MSKSDMLDRLLDLFREKGFDGASVSDISEATGLGKSSLYHHFPNGKQEMALEVLARLQDQLERALFEPTRSAGTPKQKFDRMLDGIDAFYEGGGKACLIERLSASVEVNRFRRPLGRVVAAWIDAVEGLAIEAGLPRATARLRAEDLVVRLEGALFFFNNTATTEIYTRTIRDLRESLLAPITRR